MSNLATQVVRFHVGAGTQPVSMLLTIKLSLKLHKVNILRITKFFLKTGCSVAKGGLTYHVAEDDFELLIFLSLLSSVDYSGVCHHGNFVQC